MRHSFSMRHSSSMRHCSHRFAQNASCLAVILAAGLATSTTIAPSQAQAEVSFTSPAPVRIVDVQTPEERLQTSRELQDRLIGSGPRPTDVGNSLTLRGVPERPQIDPLTGAPVSSQPFAGPDRRPTLETGEPLFYVSPHASVGTREFNRGFLVTEPTPGQPETAIWDDVDVDYYTGGISFGGCLPVGETLYDFGPNCFHGGLSYTQGSAEISFGDRQFNGGIGVAGPSQTVLGQFYAGPAELRNGRYSYDEDRFAVELGKSWPGLSVEETRNLFFLFGTGLRYSNSSIEETLTGTLTNGVGTTDFLSRSDVDIETYGAFFEMHLIMQLFADSLLGGSSYARVGGRVGLNRSELSGYDALEAGAINDRQDFSDSAWHASGRAEAAVGLDFDNGLSVELLGRAALGENLDYTINRPYADTSSVFTILPSTVNLGDAGSSAEFTGMLRTTFRF